MAFLMIKFEVGADQEKLFEELNRLDCFRIAGDWHEHRLRSVQAAGLSNDSAPSQSVIDDKERSGGSLHVSILLKNGDQLTGQLRKTSLLVSDSATTPDTVSSDSNITQVTSCFRNCVNVKSVEVG